LDDTCHISDFIDYVDDIAAQDRVCKFIDVYDVHNNDVGYPTNVDVIKANQDRVGKSATENIEDMIDDKSEKIPQVEVDTVDNLVKVDVLEKVKHTQVRVVQNIDVEVNDKHTQISVVQINEVDIPTQVGVDDSFIIDDGEHVVHNGNERSTHQAAITQNKMDNEANKNKINKELMIDDNNDKFDKENFLQNEKSKILFSMACSRIINSLKKRSDKKYDFKFGLKSDDIFKVDDKCNVDIGMLDDGRMRPRDNYCGVGVQCDDGRLRPRVKVDISLVSVDSVLDDGRLRPRENFCDVDDYLVVNDDCCWVFHDGG